LTGVNRGENQPPPSQKKGGADIAPYFNIPSVEKYPFDDTTTSLDDTPPRGERPVFPPLAARGGRNGATYRPGDPSNGRGSWLDEMVPVVDANGHPWRLRTLTLILHAAEQKRKEYASNARWHVWILNIAVGLQVLLGALVTGLASTIKPSKVGATSTALGSLATLTAAYLARMRGSQEPELSTKRRDLLDFYIRDCKVFKYQLDSGCMNNNDQDLTLERLRTRLEEILGKEVMTLKGDSQKEAVQLREA